MKVSFLWLQTTFFSSKFLIRFFLPVFLVLTWFLCYQLFLALFDSPNQPSFDFPPQQIQFADVNGDQFHDAIYLDYSDRLNTSIKVGLGNPSPSVPPQKFLHAILSSEKIDSNSLLYFNNKKNNKNKKIFDFQTFSPSKSLLYIYLTLGYEVGKPKEWLKYTASSREQWKFGDVNGDKKEDIIYFDAPDSNQVFVGLSLGSRFGKPTKWLTHGKSISEHLRIGDVNGDGMADAVYFDTLRSMRVYVSLSTGELFANPVEWLRHKKLTPDQLSLEDVNGDGKMDFIYFDTLGDSAVWVSLSLGDRFSEPGKWLQHGKSTPELLTFKDVNQDGKSDVIYYDILRTGDYWISLSTGTHFTHPVRWSKEVKVLPDASWRCKWKWHDGCFLF